MDLPKYSELICQLDGKIVIQREFQSEEKFDSARKKPTVIRETIIPIAKLSSFMKTNKIYWCENINNKQVHITVSDDYK